MMADEPKFYGVDTGAGESKTVITLGYCGDRAKNRGLEQAIEFLKVKYPGAEIRVRQVPAPGEPAARSGALDWFHANLGPVR